MPHARRASVDEVVPCTCRNNNHCVFFNCAAIAVQQGFAFTCNEHQNLVNIVRLFTNVVTGINAHQHNLAVFVRQYLLPEEVII